MGTSERTKAKKNAKERLVVKVGTNVLTRSDQHLDYNVIHQIVQQIGILHAQGHQVILVTSGASGAAWGLADFSSEKRTLRRLQLMTAVGQPRLIQMYADFFREQHIGVAQALLTRLDFGHRGHYLSICEVLDGLLERNLVPIVNENDVVAGDALTFGDNDYLAVGVAAAINADRLMLLTTTQGFYAGGDPHTNLQAKLLTQVHKITPEMWKWCAPTFSEGGRGGMHSKLKAAEVGNAFGIDVHVLPGKMPEVLFRALAKEAIGTHFVPQVKRMRSYRRWLRLAAMVHGKLVIDAGAAQALRTQKSLLFAGVVACEGAFCSGEVVEIYEEKEGKLGVGVSGWSSDALHERLKHRANSVESSNVSNDKPAIHRNHLLLV